MCICTYIRSTYTQYIYVQYTRTGCPQPAAQVTCNQGKRGGQYIRTYSMHAHSYNTIEKGSMMCMHQRIGNDWLIMWVFVDLAIWHWSNRSLCLQSPEGGGLEPCNHTVKQHTCSSSFGRKNCVNCLQEYMQKMHSRRFLWMCPWTKWCRDYVCMSFESERYCPPTRLGTIPYIL